MRDEDVREVERRLGEVEEVYAAGYEPVYAYGEALWLKRNWGSLHTHRGALGEIEREGEDDVAVKTPRKTPRCASCGKRIREHQTDLEVLEASTGKVRYYHERCGESAYAAAKAKGGAWLCTIREVDVSAN